MWKKLEILIAISPRGTKRILKIKFRTFATYIFPFWKTEIYCYFAVSPFRVLNTPAQRSRYRLFCQSIKFGAPWQLSHDSPPPIDHSTRWFAHSTELSIMKISYQRWPRGYVLWFQSPILSKYHIRRPPDNSDSPPSIDHSLNTKKDIRKTLKRVSEHFYCIPVHIRDIAYISHYVRHNLGYLTRSALHRVRHLRAFVFFPGGVSRL